jgi:hypothetical protein
MSLWGEAGADTVSPVAAENASVPVPSPPEENSLGGQEEGQPLESGMEKQHDSNQKSQVSSTNNFHRRWVSPVVLIIVIITAMPVVAHFMARDQAIADLNTNVSRFFLAARCRIFFKGAVGRRRNLVEGKY